jgi:asparagine synthase (glutamine-hydrolysing)
MCGIVAYVSLGTNRVPVSHIKAMTDSIRHRGPDDEGFVFFRSDRRDPQIYGGIDTPKSVYGSDLDYTPEATLSGQQHEDIVLALGHRRLSIIDLTPSGHQPMCTADKRYWIVYNGEIYNYLELKQELIKKGFSFRSESDTEVLLNAYSQWGKGALERLVGMFAFAIYDREENQLFLARDFFGIKPLYYTVRDGGIAFASEIKALLELPNLSYRVNPQRAYEYVTSGLADYGEDTLFQEIHQLPAAHYVHFSLSHKNNYRPTRYWNIDLSEKSELSRDEAAAKMRELFLENVKLHLRSDVAVGAALSGGIDSSSIVMAMRHVQSGHLDINTFSYIAKDSDLNEEAWVDIIGKAADITPNKVMASPEELISDLDELIYIQDEPFGSTSIYAQYRVMGLAKEKGIKVMLDGQGADEMLGGYRPYFATRLASLFRQMQWLKGCQFLMRVSRYEDCKTPQVLKHAVSYFVPTRLRLRAYNLVGRELLPSWLNAEWLKENDVKTVPSARIRGREILRANLYRDLTKQVLVGLLRYEDRNSMAYSIESRVPFLTPALASFISSLPEEYVIDMNGTSKAVFRKAMRGIVPDAILERKDKIGFATPEQLWLQNLRPWIESIISNETARKVALFDITSLKTTWREVLTGGKAFDFTVWRWINFIRWADQRNISF